MSDTIWVAIITACATFIPTIITIIVNNYFQLKFKRFEFNETAKQKAVLDYLEILGDCCYGISQKDIIKYQKSLNVLLYYFPNLNIELLNKAINSVKEEKIDKKLERILPIIKQLSKSRKEI